METLLNDVRSGVRQLIKHPGFAGIAIATLALGIGANTAVFTMVDALLFKPVAAAEPDRLAWLAERAQGSSRYRSQMSYPDYLAYRDQASGFSGMAAFGRVSLSLGGASPARVDGQLVSANFFNVLGLRPALGRTFVPVEDSGAGAHPVAVLSYGTWRDRFAADSAMIGGKITINGQPYTVIGVASAGFSGVGLGEAAEIFLPVVMQMQAMASRDMLHNADAGWLRVIGRVGKGATIEQVNAEVARIAPTLHPGRTERGEAIAQQARGGLDPTNRREAAPLMALIMVVPLLVLLVACANVANMMLARGMARRKELAVRRAIGGSRARIVRQLLTESLTLAVVAGIVGVVFAYWLTGLIVRVGNVPSDFAGALTPDMRVLGFTALIAALTTVVFGLVPALSATSSSLSPALKNESGTVVLGRVRHRMRDGFVVAQLALSLLLLVTAGLFLRSLDKALRVDPGFDARDRVAVSFDLELQGYSPEARTRFMQELTIRAAALPGVRAVASASLLPLSGRQMNNEVKAEGTPADAPSSGATYATVSPGYFETLAIDLVQGRGFTAGDRAGSPLVVVINATLARRLWGNDDPIGKKLHFTDRNEPMREVVGVVRDGKYGSLTEDPRGAMYLPREQFSDAGSDITFLVHAPGSGTALVQGVTRLIKSIDPDLPLNSALTLQASLHKAADKQQAAAAMLGVFGTLALILSALGLYGVMAHGVALRHREIGIRMALGARRSHVLSLFVNDGARLAAVGVIAGLLLSLAVSRLLSSMLFGLSATDLATFGAGGLVLSATALVASYLPARGAARVDPVVAMRAE